MSLSTKSHILLSGTFFHYLLFIFLWLHFILHLFHSLNGNLNHTVEQSEILQEFVEYFRCNLANIFDHKCLAGSMYLFKFGKEKFEQFFQYSYVFELSYRSLIDGWSLLTKRWILLFYRRLLFISPKTFFSGE